MKELEERLLEAQELAHLGNWEYNAENDTVIWSKEMFNIFGRSYDLPAPKYSEQQPFYTKESFAILDKAVQDCIQRGIPYEIELEIVKGSGSIGHIISKGKAKKDECNKINGAIGIALDITDRKNAEKKVSLLNEQLQEANKQLEEKNRQLLADEQQLRVVNKQAVKNKEYYYSILNNIVDPFFIKDNHSRLIFVNESFCRFFDLQESEIIGKTLGEDVAPEELENFLKVDKQVLRTGKVSVIEESITIRGSATKTISTTKSRFINNGKKLLVGTTRDITNRKNAENALLESNQKLQAANQQLKALEQTHKAANKQLKAQRKELLKSNQQLTANEILLANKKELLTAVGKMAKVGGWEYDLRTTRLIWSEETCRIHGVPLDYAPLLQEAIDFYHPKDRLVLKKAIEKAIDKGESFDLTLRFINANGENLITRAVCNPELEDSKVVKLKGTFQDVTEWKRAEEELRKTDQWFRFAQDLSPDGFTIFNPIRNKKGDVTDFTFLYQNEAIAQLNGTDSKKIIGKRLLEIFPTHKNTRFFKTYVNAAKYRKTITFEEQYSNDPMSEPIWFRIAVVPMDENIAVLAQNITEKKKAEIQLSNTVNSLLETNKRFDEAQAMAKIANYEYDLVNDTYWASNEAKRIYGYSLEKEEFSVEDVWKCIPDTKRVQQAWIDLIEKDAPYNLEHEIRPVTGPSSKIIKATGQVVKDKSGKPIKVVGLIQDITDIKEVEGQIALSNKKYQELFDDAPIPLWEEDISELVRHLKKIKKEGNKNIREYFKHNSEEVAKCTKLIKITNINKATLKLHKAKSKEDLISNFDKIFTSKSLETFKEEVIAIAEGKKEFKTESEVKTLDNEIRHISMQIKIIAPKSGKSSVLLATSDITEIKKAEDQLKIYRDHLEDLVEERTSELKEVNKELESFSYSVSHDLRAPIRHINGYINMLNHHFPDALPEKGKHFLDTIADSANQMGTLIDDLLELSRTGRQAIDIKTIDMNEVINEVLKSFEDDVDQRDIEWKIVEFPKINCDRSLIKLVWVNLISNAIKFTGKIEKAIIEVGYQYKNKEHTIFISDNGVGFNMKYADKLFGAFHRLHSKADFEGTGIGLANFQRIIQRHKGRVWAESDEGKGAAFYFTLPKKYKS